MSRDVSMDQTRGTRIGEWGHTRLGIGSVAKVCPQGPWRYLTQEKNELLNQLSSLRDELKTATSDAGSIDASLQQIDAQLKSPVSETSEKIIPTPEMIANDLVHFNLG